jgi:hypothetical protein
VESFLDFLTWFSRKLSTLRPVGLV